MEQRTSAHDIGAATEFEKDVFQLLLKTVRRALKWELGDVGTETVLYELVSGDSAEGSATAPGMKASGSLGGAIAARTAPVWISQDAGDGTAETPDEEREIDAVWREVRGDEAKRQRFKNRKKPDEEKSVRLPPMTGALRSCLRRALESAREEGTVAVRVRHVARALVELPGTRAREIMTVEKVDAAAASAALDALRGSEEMPESGSVCLLRRAGLFGKSGNPLTRKFSSWILGGGAGFGSPVVGVVHAEGGRSAVRRGAPETEAVDVLLGILRLERALAVADRELPENLRGVNRGAELLRLHGARQDALARALAPGAGIAEEEEPPDNEGGTDFGHRLMHVTKFTASAGDAPTVGTTHLLAALLDPVGSDEESAAEAARVLTESGVDVEALRAEPELRVPGGAARAS